MPVTPSNIGGRNRSLGLSGRSPLDRRDGARMKDGAKRRHRIPDAISRRHERGRLVEGRASVSRYRCRRARALAAGRDKSELRYIFHREMFWKRLGGLDDPAAHHLRRPLGGPSTLRRPRRAGVHRARRRSIAGPLLTSKRCAAIKSGSGPSSRARRGRRRDRRRPRERMSLRSSPTRSRSCGRSRQRRTRKRRSLVTWPES